MRKYPFSWKTSILIAAISRIFVLFLCLSFDLTIPDHTATDVFHFRITTRTVNLERFLSSFSKWDSAHFLTIADLGYSDEQSLAFYPFFPMLVRSAAMSVEWLIPFERHSMMIIFAVIISNMSFILSSIVFSLIAKDMRISIAVQTVAFLSHVFSPASIFYSVPYTESTFAAFSWLGIWLMDNHPGYEHLAALPFFLASLLRSNGSINAVFVIASCVAKFSVFVQFAPTEKSSRAILRLVASTAVNLIAISHPHFYWNIYGKQIICLKFNDDFCPTMESDSNCGLEVLCSDNNRNVLSFKTAYSYVQEKYWNVGFLRYYQLKQIPNFLLAAPAIFIAGFGIFVFFRSLFSNAIHKADGRLRIFEADDDLQSNALLTADEWLRWAPHIAHLCTLLVVALLLAHVQITTRLLFSSCPIMYIISARLFLDQRSRLPMQLYFGFFFFVGILLHVNWYPWT